MHSLKMVFHFVTQRAIKNGQFWKTDVIGYTRRRKTKQKPNNTICVGHHYAQANKINVNKTSAFLQTTGGKDEPNIVLCGNRNGHHIFFVDWRIVVHTSRTCTEFNDKLSRYKRRCKYVYKHLCQFFTWYSASIFLTRPLIEMVFFIIIIVFSIKRTVADI